MTTRRVFRLLQIAAVGGVVFQAAGCVSGLGPVALSLVESFTLEFIFRAVVPGL